MWFPNRSDTNQAVQAQKLARGWKFWIYKVDELCFPYGVNKGADQLRRYGEADQRLWFRICRLFFFLMRRLKSFLSNKFLVSILILFHEFESYMA